MDLPNFIGGIFYDFHIVFPRNLRKKFENIAEKILQQIFLIDFLPFSFRGFIPAPDLMSKC